jgi:hypothetical protein
MDSTTSDQYPLRDYPELLPHPSVLAGPVVDVVLAVLLYGVFWRTISYAVSRLAVLRSSRRIEM